MNSISAATNVRPATYLLRSTFEGVAYYLEHVSGNGCNVTFNRNLDHALRFNVSERNALVEDHGHIRGRWVLLYREEKRRPIPKGADDH